MHLKASIHDYELDDLFRKFRDIIGDRHWRRRVKKLNEEILGNQFLRDYHHQENEIAYQLSCCSDLLLHYGRLPVGQMDLFPIYPAMAFASHCLSMLESMEATNRTRTIGRIQGAFQNPEDMRALQLEFTVALHFTKLGYQLGWPELEAEGDTYDLLVKDIESSGLEVECKAISEGKGRQISTRHALDFWHLMQPDLKTVTRYLHDGLSIVLTLPDKLPTRFAERKELSKLVARTILSGQSQTYPQAEIAIRDFDAQLLHRINWNNASQGERELIDSITGTCNRQVMVRGIKEGVAVICVIQSKRDDTLFDAIQKTVKKAATKQLTGNRPRMILLEFNGISPESMVNLAEHDKTPGNAPTSLLCWASKFLSNAIDRDHVVGIGFLSRGAMSSPSENVVTNSGSTYVFTRQESKYWDDAFRGLFNSENMLEQESAACSATLT
ncbi:hypothetical protein [Methylomonas fluvii]|uniref:Uncharacterized protein n=1 Tax=Methylomonas fluvii TaxID=1854564 RepID=A0ABR9D7P8_9GAMM|nr:hypothetical protein [Methylomonas fluvii]MBD9358975.1 hypothetical protein [Methylomonas fluvii]